jgi:hypothetical protein
LGNEVPLIDPYKAEIVLAIHRHGPALQGQQLKHQLNSFSGACVNFIGPDGFAASPEDVPDQVGECSTIQFSRHQRPFSRAASRRLVEPRRRPATCPVA